MAQTSAIMIGKEAARLMKSIEGKNTYSQAASKRERVFEVPGFGDCSSTVRKAHEKAGLARAIGGNTSAQMANRMRVGIIVDTSKNGYPNLDHLRPGDCLYFKGNTAHVKGVGHVEMYVGSGECSGHGGGIGPKRKNVREYCRSRISASTRYFMAIRWAWDFGERDMFKGTQGGDVWQLQTALLDLGCTILGKAGPGRDGIDGDFGSATERAVKWYQALKGVTVNGRVNASLAAMILEDVKDGNVDAPLEGEVEEDEPARDYALGARVLQMGDVGADVAELQAGLVKLGYDVGNTGDAGDGVDGEYGSRTAAAVILFQTEHKISGSGLFDSKTFTAFAFALAQQIVDEVEPVLKYPVRGIRPDISAYQGKVDTVTFSKGTDFGILRFMVNGKADTQAQATAAGINENGGVVLAYDYVVFTTEAKAVELANAFVDRAIAFKPRVWYMDLETKADGVTYAQTIKCARAYIAQLRKRGVKKVGLYTGDYLYRTRYYVLEGDVDDVWLAAYGENNGFLSKLPTKRVGGLHQYTSMGGATVNGVKVPGVPGIIGRVDLNRLTGEKRLSWYTEREHDGVEYVGVAKVSGDTVNIRAGAYAASDRLGTVTRGSIFERREGDVDGWIAIVYKGKNAYISAKLVALVAG